MASDHYCRGADPLSLAALLVALATGLAATRSEAADKLWDNPKGGDFEEPSNWFGGVPGQSDVARFGITDSSFFQRSYTVDLSSRQFNQQLVVEDDDVTLRLSTPPNTGLPLYGLANPF